MRITRLLCAAAMSSSIRLEERLATATPGRRDNSHLAQRAREYSSPMYVPAFVDDGQPIGIRILGEADGGTVAANFIGQGNQILFGRLRLVRKSAVGRGIQMNELAAELAEQRGRGDAAGAVDAVEHHLDIAWRKCPEHPRDPERA